MDITSLLDQAKSQLTKIQTQLTGSSVSPTLKGTLLQNQQTLQKAYDSLLNQSGIYDDQTKQQLIDALSSAEKASLAATADADNKILYWMGGLVAGVIVISIVIHKLLKKQTAT